MEKETILTGLRVNSDFTLGNYLGAILPMVQFAKEKSANYNLQMFIPDLHTITVDIDYASLQNAISNALTDFVAAGLPLDNDNILLYRQSYISAHSELAWILECFTGFGEASRMVEFKDKSSQIGEDRVSAGLFNYPMLMAADILLYDARWVPVGEDQRQHIELTRTLAQRLNNKFGDLFTVPADSKDQASFAGLGEPLRIRSLRNPEKKMSKSISDPAGTILLNDDPSAAAKKVMSATTDSKASIAYNWQEQPGITNLLQLYAQLYNVSQQQANQEWVGQSQYGALKTAVASATESLLTEHQAARGRVNMQQIYDKLINSERILQQKAQHKLSAVQKAVGLR